MGPGAYLGRGLFAYFSVNNIVGVIEIDLWQVYKQVHIALPVSFYSTNVPPIAMKPVGHDFLISDHGWQYIFAKIMAAVWVYGIKLQLVYQDFRTEHIYSH